MKTIAFVIGFFLLSIFGFSQEKGITIIVTVNNIKNNNGHVTLGLHSNDTFMKANGIQNTKSQIVDGKITATFTNVAPGTYAILALHDANDNGQMDYQASGMPNESYGMSNNPTSFGPPEFSEAKFQVNDTDLEMKINF